jgi:hypothetical protein
MKAKRPAHRPQKYPGEQMTTLSVRLPVRLREKLARISDGKAAEWVCARIEKARDTEPNAKVSGVPPQD